MTAIVKTPGGEPAGWPGLLHRLRTSGVVREAAPIVRVYVRNRPAVVGALLLFGFGIVAAFAPWIAPADPLQIELTREALFQPPSWDHLLGTDAQGRDVLSRTIFGARIAWQIVLAAIGISIAVGVPLGLISGYIGGKLDELVIMRMVDAVMALPGLILILAVTGALGPSITNSMIIIGIVWSPAYARLTRGVVLSIKGRCTSRRRGRWAPRRRGSCGGTCCPTRSRRSWCWPRSRPRASSSSKRGSASSARACKSPRPPGAAWCRAATRR